jgi:hypothetical protein
LNQFLPNNFILFLLSLQKKPLTMKNLFFLLLTLISLSVVGQNLEINDICKNCPIRLEPSLDSYVLKTLNPKESVTFVGVAEYPYIKVKTKDGINGYLSVTFIHNQTIHPEYRKTTQNNSTIQKSFNWCSEADRLKDLFYKDGSMVTLKNYQKAVENCLNEK